MIRLKTAAALVVTVFAAGTAQAVLIDFDTFPDTSSVPDGTSLTTQYASLGVTFTGFEDGFQIAPEMRGQEFLSVPASLPKYLTNFHSFPSTAAVDSPLPAHRHRVDSGLIALDFLSFKNCASPQDITAGVGSESRLSENFTHRQASCGAAHLTD